MFVVLMEGGCGRREGRGEGGREGGREGGTHQVISIFN